MEKSYPLFNIDKIRKTLTDVCRRFDSINEQLETGREKMTMLMVEQMLEAYGYLNGLLEKKMDLFSPAGMYSMLELNHIVLCGTDVKKRFEYHRHILETRNRFQECAREIRSWYKKKGRDLDTYSKVTEFYAIALSQPQMFVEGNHRTENIIINYLLITEGKPPFVLDPQNAVKYLNLSARIKFSDRRNMILQMTSFPKNRKGLADVLEEYGNTGYLCGISD